MKLSACLAGFGIAQVIDLGLELQFATGALIHLFPDWSDERFPLYVYHVSRNHVPPKVRTIHPLSRRVAQHSGEAHVQSERIRSAELPRAPLSASLPPCP